MPLPLFRVTPRLFAALFLGAAGSWVALTDPVLQPLQAYFSYQANRLLPTLPARRCRPSSPVLFADAFKFPTGSYAARHVGTLQPISVSCDNANSPRSFYRSLFGVSAASACAPELRPLGQQSTWTLRASIPPPARLNDSLALAAPRSAFGSGDRSFCAVKTSPTAVSAGAGGLSTSSSELAAPPERLSAIAESSPVTLSALPSAFALGDQTTPGDGPHVAVTEAEASGSGMSTTTAAATARVGESEKAPAAESLGPVVTRKDLLASLTAELQLPRADVERTVVALLRYITANLEMGRKVSISKFGSFNVRRRKERVARNPRTGEALNVAAATFPTFSFSKILKERVRDVIPATVDEEHEEEPEETVEEQPQSNKRNKQLPPWP